MEEEITPPIIRRDEPETSTFFNPGNPPQQRQLQDQFFRVASGQLHIRVIYSRNVNPLDILVINKTNLLQLIRKRPHLPRLGEKYDNHANATDNNI